MEIMRKLFTILAIFICFYADAQRYLGAVKTFTSGYDPNFRRDDDSYTLGLWHFDETSGTTSQDESSNNNDATLVNATFSETGALLNGTDAYISIPDVLADVPIAGTIAMDFELLSAVSSTFTLFHRPSTSGYSFWIELKIKNDGRLICKFANFDPIEGDAHSWSVGRHTVAMAWDNLFHYYFIDGELYLKVPCTPPNPLGSGGGAWSGNDAPFTIGASVDFSSNYSSFANIKVNSLVVENKYFTKGAALNFHQNVEWTSKPNIEDRLFPQDPVLVLEKGDPGDFDEWAACEPITFEKTDGTICLYYTAIKTGYEHSIGLATAATPEGTYTKQGIKLGLGTVGNRELCHAFGWKVGSDWYIMGTNGLTGSGMYLYKSTNEGTTWTDEGLQFLNTLVSAGTEAFGNIAIIPRLVGGYYYAMVDKQTGTGLNQWENYVIRSTSLTDWTGAEFVEKSTNLAFTEGTNAGVTVYWTGSKYVAFPQYTGDEDLDDYTLGLPSRNYYCESTDLVTWTRKQTLGSIATLDLGFNIDQLADIDILQHSSGVCYLFQSYMQNSGDFTGAIGYQKFNGTLSELTQ